MSQVINFYQDCAWFEVFTMAMVTSTIKLAKTLQTWMNTRHTS